MINRRNLLKLIASSAAIGFPKFAIGSIPGWKNPGTKIPLHQVMRFSISYSQADVQLILKCRDGEGKAFERHFETMNCIKTLEKDDEALPIMEMYQKGDKFSFTYSDFQGNKRTYGNLKEVKRTLEIIPEQNYVKDSIRSFNKGEHREAYLKHSKEEKHRIQQYNEKYKELKDQGLNSTEVVEGLQEWYRQGRPPV